MPARDMSRKPKYQTEFQCENCLEWFAVRFEDPSETFKASCPHCGAHYEELYV